MGDDPPPNLEPPHLSLFHLTFGVGRYRVFLDRRDAGQLHDLPTLVARSRCLIFVLSPGIFQSTWCLVELHAAVLAGVSWGLPKNGGSPGEAVKGSQAGGQVGARGVGSGIAGSVDEIAVSVEYRAVPHFAAAANFCQPLPPPPSLSHTDFLSSSLSLPDQPNPRPLLFLPSQPPPPLLTSLSSFMQVPCVPVRMDGALWEGRSFPDLDASYVPKTVQASSGGARIPVRPLLEYLFKNKVAARGRQTHNDFVFFPFLPTSSSFPDLLGISVRFNV